MKNSTRLLRILSNDAASNPLLRDALTDIALALLSETHADSGSKGAQDHYPELILLIDQKRQEYARIGRHRLCDALQVFGKMIQDDLKQAALNGHEALSRYHMLPQEADIQKIGIDLTGFETGFTERTDLLKLSEAYLNCCNHAAFLSRHFPNRFADAHYEIDAIKKSAKSQLYDIAWNAADNIITAMKSDADQLQLRTSFVDKKSSLHHEIEAQFNDILHNAPEFWSEAIKEGVHNWMVSFGTLCFPVLENHFKQNPRNIIETLASIKSSLGLEALSTLPVPTESHTLFCIAMTLRFGNRPFTTVEAWQVWLQKELQGHINRDNAIHFWEQHPYLIADCFDALNISEKIQQNWRASAPLITVKVFLEQCTIWATPETIAAIETACLTLAGHPEKTIVEKDPMSADDKERKALSATDPTTAAKKPPANSDNESTAKPNSILENIANVAADVASGENIAHAGVESFAETALGLLDDRLSVTIDEPVTEEETAIGIDQLPATSIWRDYILPLIHKNLFFVVMSTAIFSGLLILLFSLWDKHAIIRFGLAPSTLVGIAYGLAYFGYWLQKIEVESTTSVPIIQTVSIYMAPMSFVFVGMLAADPELSLLWRIVWGVLLSAGLLFAWYMVIGFSVKSIYTEFHQTHIHLLLFLNGLFLLVPIANFAGAGSGDTMQTGARAILTTGFYLGFLSLIWSMRQMLHRFMHTSATDASLGTIIFFCTTCLGTFLLVWGLTHVRLAVLPNAYTYGPLIVLGAVLFAMIEFNILHQLRRSGRMSVLTFLCYFFTMLGVLMSIGHPVVRVLALLLAGAVFYYLADKLKDEKHYGISLVIFVIAVASVSLTPFFPRFLFPVLGLAISLLLYFVASISFSYELADPAQRLSRVCLALAFIVSVIWHWLDPFTPIFCGLSFAGYSLFTFYRGIKKNYLVDVHAAAAYMMAAIPYLGFADMTQLTFSGNTLVLGLTFLGYIWVAFSTFSRFPAIRDSRSTVLWSICMVTITVLIVRLLTRTPYPANPIWLYYSAAIMGPVLMTVLILLTGYFTRSYIPVYLSLIIMVLIAYTLKNQLHFPMRSGLGKTAVAIGCLASAFLIQSQKWFSDLGPGDLVWRKKPFPFTVLDHRLFTIPLNLSALMLFMLVIFYNYNRNYFIRTDFFSIKTAAAMIISATALHAFSIRLKRTWPSYIGFIAAALGVLTLFTDTQSDLTRFFYFPLFLFAAVVYHEFVGFIIKKINPARYDVAVRKPFMRYTLIYIWVAAFGLYALYSSQQSNFFIGWLALFSWIISIASYHLVTQRRRSLFLALFMLLWSVLCFSGTKGVFLADMLAPHSTFYIITPLMILAYCIGPAVLKPTCAPKDYSFWSTPLFISLIPLTFGSVYIGYVTWTAYSTIVDVIYPNLQLLLWAATCFCIGYLLQLSPLWLLGTLLIYLFVIPVTERPPAFSYLHPLALSGLAATLFGMQRLIYTFPQLFFHRHPWSWTRNDPLKPDILFLTAGRIVGSLVFLQALFNPLYGYKWSVIAGMFITAIIEVAFSPRRTFFRQFVFFLFYTIACITAMLKIGDLSVHVSLFTSLIDGHFLLCGVGLALLTTVAADALNSTRFQFNTTETRLLAASFWFGNLILYFSIGELNSQAWPSIGVIGLLLACSAVYFHYNRHIFFTPVTYGMFAVSLTVSIICFCTMLLDVVLHLRLTPFASFTILFLPAALFYVRCEYLHQKRFDCDMPRRTTTLLLFFIMAAFFAPRIVEMMQLPASSIGLAAAQLNAIVLFAAGIAAIRLQAFNAHPVTLYSGLLAGIIAIALLITLLPTLNPLHYPERYAIFSICLGWGLLFLCEKNRWGKKIITRIAARESHRFESVRLFLFCCILIGAHIGILFISVYVNIHPLTALILFILAGLWGYTAHCWNRCWFNYFAYAALLGTLYFTDTIILTSGPYGLFLLSALFIAMIPFYTFYAEKHFSDAERHYHRITALTAALILTVYSSFPAVHTLVKALFPLIFGCAVCIVPVSIHFRPKRAFRIFLGVLVYLPIWFLILFQKQLHVHTLLWATGVSLIIFNYKTIAGRITLKYTHTPRLYHHLHWYLSREQAFFPIVSQSFLTLIVCALVFPFYPSFLRDHHLAPFLLAGHAIVWIGIAARQVKTIFYHIAFLMTIVAIFSLRMLHVSHPETLILTGLLIMFVILTGIFSSYLKEHVFNAQKHYLAWAIILSALIVSEYTLYFGPSSSYGLSLLIILWLAAFCIPISADREKKVYFRFFLGLFLYVPVYFWLVLLGKPPLDHIISTNLIAVAISALIMVYHAYRGSEDSQPFTTQGEYRMAHHVHVFLTKQHRLFPSAAFAISTGILLIIHALMIIFHRSFSESYLFSMFILHLTLIVFWFDWARRKRHAAGAIIAQLMTIGLILTLRRETPLVLGLEWTETWDIVTGFLAALTISLTKPIFEQTYSGIQRTFRFTLFGLPIITFIYAFAYDIDMTILANITLLYSVLFSLKSYQEKDRFVLAYALLGFNTFLIMTFIRSHIQTPQAYVTPVSLSVLVLVQIFKHTMSHTTANIVRIMALMTLLGVSMIQIITDNLLSPLSHIMLISLCCLSMAAAILLRIRVFALAGLFCFMIDIIALISIILSNRDTDTRKIIIGLSLTCGGGLSMYGYILYRKNKPRIDDYFSRLKARFMTWE